MKIVFICGSLEPSRDGVGDYTRKLAQELIIKGQFVAAVSINDQYISEQKTEVYSINNTDFHTLRIPSIIPVKERFVLAKHWIDKLNPDWISVQFVSFSFQKKGLFFGLSKQFSQITKGRYLQIMFHELWVGMDSDSSLKYKLWGKIQQKLILSLIKELKPAVIHTQTNLYRLYLQKLGLNVSKLALFSNISVIGDIKTDTNAFKKNKKISFVVFGSIHPGVPVEDFTKEINQYANENKIQVVLTIVGRSGNEQERWVKVWESSGISVELLGEQSPEYISKTLSSASIGLSTTPIALAEKSGTIAAMTEHGLNVICITYPWKVKGIDIKAPDGIVEYRIGRLKELFNQLSNDPPINSVSTIASQLMEDLIQVM